jgi:hypothetical protein
MPAILSDVVVDVVAAVEKLRADGRLIADQDQMLNEVEAILDTITSLQAEVVHRLRDVWDADATSVSCGRSTKRWLIEEQLLAGPDAGRYLRVSRLLPLYPVTAAAFDAARITIAHVAAILTALASLPPDLRELLEPHLVERARYHPPEEIAGFVDELLQALGVDRVGDIRRERRHNSRGVECTRTLDGTRALSGTLTPDAGDTLDQALQLAGAPTGPDDDRTPRQRAHDALAAIAAAYLARHRAPSFTGAPRSMIITMDLAMLEGRLRDTWLTLPDATTISADTARRLACDAELIPIVLGSKAEVLDIGAANREFTVSMRRAAYQRDGGRCAFPGCRGQLAELHHITFRRHGGPGTLDNAAWLCTYHHWLAHEGHWTLQRTPTGDYLWTGPNGQQRLRHLQTDQE